MRNLCDDCKDCEYKNNCMTECMDICGVPLDILEAVENKRNKEVGDKS